MEGSTATSKLFGSQAIIECFSSAALARQWQQLGGRAKQIFLKPSRPWIHSYTMEPVKLLPLSPGYQSFVCARAPAHAHTHMHESTRKHDRDRTHARTHTANTHKQVAVQEYSHCNSLHMFRGISSLFMLFTPSP